VGKRALPAQASLSSRGHGRGGFRAAAGRPPKAESERKGHHPRPELAARFPVHVTMRRVADGPAFRRGDCYAVLRRCFAAGKSRFGFRLVHYSVQGNHIHLICEADDRQALSRGKWTIRVHWAKPHSNPPVVPPATWLLEHGWRLKRGPRSAGESPAAAS